MSPIKIIGVSRIAPFRLVAILLFLLGGQGVFAQDWGMMLKKVILTNDVQEFNVGSRNGQNDFNTVNNNEAYHPELSIQFFINGQPNVPENHNPFGSILSGTFYNQYRHEYYRRLFFEAPDKMPDKNPVEVKAVITLANGQTVTATATIYILAEKWRFIYAHGIHYRCYDGGEGNPKNILTADMGMVTQMQQDFHFDKNTIFGNTFEATAVMEGDPEITGTHTYQGGSCYPSQNIAKLQWGDDDQTKIKDVKVKFSDGKMKVDYKIDYMNYLGWNIVQKATGYVISVIARKPGKHDAQANVVAPLQKKFVSKFASPVDQQIMMHSAEGVILEALE